SLGERQPPRIPLLRWLRLVDQDGNVAVDLLRELRVVFTPEDRAGPGVRVDEAEVLRGQSEPTPADTEVLDPHREEGELRGLRAAQGEQGELVAAVHPGENRLPILEVIQRHEPPPLDDLAEERLRRV